MLNADQPEVDLDRVAERLRLKVRRAPALSAKAHQGPQINVKRIAGFGPMARLTTSFGEVYAQALRKGDMLRTTAGMFVRIEHVDRMKLDEDFLSRYPSVLPVRLRKGAIGPGLPAQDVLLAPYQLVRPGPARSVFPMVEAFKLLEKPFVSRATESQITYTRLFVGKPATIYCEGLAVEI